MEPKGQDTPKPPTIEYSSQQNESTRTHLEVFAKHSRKYMGRHGECEVCMHTLTLSVLLNQLLVDPQGKDLLGVLVTQPMVDLLYATFDHMDDPKGLTANQVVRMWPAHYNQFGTFQTIMSEFDREVLHITDVKAI